MQSPLQLPVQRWSTDDVPSTQRFDYYADALGSALVPMQIARKPGADFAAQMTVADLGGLAVVRQTGTAHRCFTEARDLARSQERSFHLLVNVSAPWTIRHRGHARMAPGDVMLADSQIVYDIDTATDYEFVHVKFSEGWMRQWMPSPGALIGRPIEATTGWGRALSAFIAPLSAEFLLRSPLPISVIADQIGSLLALTLNDMGPPSSRPTRSDTALFDRIVEHMRQRSTSPSLTASEVAASLDLPLRSFHRCFEKCGDTFGNVLVRMRFENGMRMLQSPLLRRLTVSEIARRSGFCDASHFSRVVRARSGHSPSQIRRDGLPTLPEAFIAGAETP
ncbi:helix-turn-helix domain-containing protein [Variovorax sp. Sphag1AA]|uniref:helix-turn-helix domain-containing protein n=1 Tax=Variovorax sp. Sphag1AA TaxID=2587027 RepID=UPI00160DBF17|nr:helix-turn-helix domain-containing protein [Variovorax sp. Sphag1AA]MBB3178136.1 AraC-like DNA-binding protein [Variovorax sp. Sphag1AA]